MDVLLIKILALLTIGFLITAVAWKIRSMWNDKRNNPYKETR